MFSAQGINLTTLIKRLEAATSRLEDLAVANTNDFREAQAAQRSSATPSLSKEVTPQFNTGVFAPETRNSVASEPITEEEKSPVITDYEKFIQDQVEPWIGKSEKIGSVVGEQGTAVGHLFQVQLVFLQVVQKAQEPSSPQILLELLTPTQLALDAVTSIREHNRASKLFNHLATVGEGIAAAGWVTIEGAEAPKYVGEMRDASQFYGNRVVREYKDSDDTLHKEWQTSFTEILNELQKYVRKHFPQGIKWNSAGVPADQFIGTSSPGLVTSSSSLTANSNNPPAPARTPSPGTGPPPPPPPPPPESLLAAAKGTSSGSSTTKSMGAVFSQINQGEGITSALKHVDKSQMTHKNPTLREKRTSPHLPPKPASLQRNPSGGPVNKANKPAGKKALAGSKWIIENFDGEKAPIKIEESETDINHSILIYGVKNSTIQIGGKINTVSMTNCEGTGLVLDTLVAGIELAKSKKIQLQILNKAPMVNVDHVDQLTIYLSKTCLDAEIITTCVTGVNIQVPNEKEDGDYFERPVPEMCWNTPDENGFEIEVRVPTDKSITVIIPSIDISYNI